MVVRLSEIADEAVLCTRCPLYRSATQTVFGDGPATASLVLVGEQPGDNEDRADRPFVGPAGKQLDRAFAEIGLDRSTVYVTNAVKHFKNEPQGKRCLHKRPDRDEIVACRWWLDLELEALRPGFVVALGATAAYALMGRTVILARERGRLLRWSDHLPGLATIHPSPILRTPGEIERHEAFSGFVRDLREALRLTAGEAGARVSGSH